MFHRAFRGLALEMGVSKCRLELVPFHLVFLLQRLTSMMEDLLQVRHSKQDNSACFLTTPHLIIFSSILQTAAPGTPQHIDEQFLSRLFLFVALVIMFWLLIA